MAKKSSDTIQAPTVASIHPFKRVRRAGVPISFFESADPAALVLACTRSLNGAGENTPCVQYDISAGFRPVQGNRAGDSWLKSPDAAEILGVVPMGPAAVFQAMANKPPGVGDIGADDRCGAVVFVHNAHKILESDFGAVQATWNCRDSFKSGGTSLVLIGVHSRVPAELKNDIPLFSEDVPKESDIDRIVSSVCNDANIEESTIDRPKVIDGLLGYLSEFSVEQSLCLALKTRAEGGGVDIDQLWKLKVAALRAVAGLDITLPKSGFDSMAGNAGVKQVINYHLKGREQPRAILWLDEIEKMVAGSTGGDLSGTSQAIIEQFLNWTQDRRVKGFLLVGVPGAGKSLTCKATAGQAVCPLLRASMSTVKGSLVGQSEQQMRSMLASVDAVAQGRVLMIATCNSYGALSPELMSRFTLGTIFFDYPTPEERAAIWAHYMAKYELRGSIPANSANWVGREIESCCERAYMWNIPLAEAAATVVPACTANAAKLDELRRSAHGRFLSAAQPGLYQVETAQSAVTGGRKLNLS